MRGLAAEIANSAPVENPAAIELTGPLRYTGTRLIMGGTGAEPASPPAPRRFRSRR